MIDYAVILALGNLTHQSQLTYNRARAMLPVLGKPLVVRAMEQFYKSGVHNFTVVLTEKEGSVASYLDKHWVPDAQVEFLVKSSKDTLQTLLRQVARQHNRPFLISAYNTFTHSHYPERLDKYSQNFGDELVLTATNTNMSRSSNRYYARVNEDQITQVSSDPIADGLIVGDVVFSGQNFVDYLADLPEQPSEKMYVDLMEIVQSYLATGSKAHLVNTAWMLSIETDYDLLTLNKLLLDEQQDAHILSELPYTVQITPPVRIDPQVSIGQYASIGPHAYLETGCSVGHGATVRNAVILQKAIVGAGETVEDSILATRARIRG